MPIGANWSQTTALDPKIIQSAVGLQVNIEEMFSADNKLLSKGKMVSIVDENQALVKLGEVSASRPLIRHDGAMEIILKELDATGIPYKLLRSTLDERRYFLWQEYLFDKTVQTPDGSLMSAMIAVRYDYVDLAPVEIGFGVYDYETGSRMFVANLQIPYLKFSSRNWDVLHQAGALSQEITNAMRGYAEVDLMFQGLNSTLLEDAYQKLFSSNRILLGIRKKILAKYEEAGVVGVSVPTDKTTVKSYSRLLTEGDLSPELIDSVVKVTNDKYTMWNVYKDFMMFSSWKIPSLNGVLILNRALSVVFPEILR